MAQRLALIRYYFHAVPNGIDEFAQMWGQLHFALQWDGKLKIQERVKG